MNLDRLKQILERVTGVAAFSALVLLCSFVAIKQFKQNSIDRVVVQGLEKGQQFPRLPTLDYERTRATMLIALDTECEHCVKALTFYKDIARSAAPGFQVVALFPNTNEPVREYAKRHELSFAIESSVDLSRLNISAMPTLILVDNESKIIDFWVGEASPERQRSIIQTLSAL